MHKTSFQEKVHKFVQKIPKGKVATYGEIARLSGSPRAARAVGTCMKNNLYPKITPCHRVVASNGALSGYAFGKGVSTKKEMLEKEGVVFVANRADLRTSGWKGITMVDSTGYQSVD